MHLEYWSVSSVLVLLQSEVLNTYIDSTPREDIIIILEMLLNHVGNDCLRVLNIDQKCD